ncbi:hypothetical protein DM01DRAFT_329434 [Hesseltinella vesiculosa]|uniref:Phosphatidylglycerol/phosphatidylinositol transfer protein n=1 Tax=Hesseltinella vesiculosa TaxID=101127 RepID=A0A1X2GNR0_9FUNG|nr:hypothetical protein DM01DRAFT_329434 [Hesseltinella vesiculosa]
MSPADHGDIWSLCGDPTQHLLQGYKDGVSISPDMPRTGEAIDVQVNGRLASDVTGGKVTIQLNIMNMIKINKDLDLCNVLRSDVMQADCPIPSGDVTLNAKAFIPKELPKLPLKGDVRISDQNGNTVTCISLDFKLH